MADYSGFAPGNYQSLYPAGGGGGGGVGSLTGSFSEFETSPQRRQGMRYPEYQAWAAQAQNTPATFGTQAFVQQERQNALNLYQQDRAFYDSPDAQALQRGFMDRAMGKVQPFTPSVVQNMYGQSAAGANGSFAAERDMIRQNMANSGLGGSGAETTQLLMAQRKASQQAMAGRRDITSRASLENYGALERAQQAAAAYLEQVAAQKQASAFAEAGFRGEAKYGEERGSGGQVTSGGRVIQGGAVEKPRDTQANAQLQQLKDMQAQLDQLLAGGQAGPVGGSAPVNNDVARYSSGLGGGSGYVDPYGAWASGGYNMRGGYGNVGGY